MKTLFVTDLDGTLLDGTGNLSAESRCIINRLCRRGALITCATARTPATVQPMFSGVALTAPAVVMTGAAFWTINQPHPHFEYENFIPTEQVAQLDAIFNQLGLNPFVYVRTQGTGTPLEFYHSSVALSAGEQEFVAARRHLALKKFVYHTAPEATATRRLLYFAIGSEHALKSAASIIKEQTPCAVSCYPDSYCAGQYLIEVFAPGVSKAAGVLRLKELVGAERLVVYGDNLNDLPMMAVADVAVAAPRALEQVKAQAHVVLDESAAAVPEHMAAMFEQYD